MSYWSFKLQVKAVLLLLGGRDNHVGVPTVEVACGQDNRVILGKFVRSNCVYIYIYVSFMDFLSCFCNKYVGNWKPYKIKCFQPDSFLS